MFSAVTSAFIVDIDPQLKPDSGDETASLLRLLIYKLDNTTFGNDVPVPPQWTGPPRTMVQVQAILFASLAISLFSAFLAMLGKQWLYRYRSIDMRGSAIERSRNRQQKLSGIVVWYFDYVMESFPLMLQAALLLLGCALSLYLWGIDITVASVILGFTSFSVLLYLLITIAGTASESCPYQTPGTIALRYILHHYLPPFRSAPTIVFAVVSNCSEFIRTSRFYSTFTIWWSLMKRPWHSVSNISYTLVYYLLGPPVALAVDCYRLVRAVLRILVASGRAVYRWFATTLSPRLTHSPEQRTTVLDLQCVSWTLQTSLDKDVRLATLKRLVAMPEFSYRVPTLVMDCFGIFIDCVNVSDGRVGMIQGLDQLATVSANGLFRTFRHLMVMDPTSTILADLHQRYNRVFPTEVDFAGLPFYSTMTLVHALVGRFGNPRYVWWNDRRLSGQDYVPFSQRVLQAARVKHRQTQRRKVPRWTLRSALHFLSLGSLSPAPVVVDYLMIIALDMSCDVPDITSLDTRWVRI